MLPGFLVGALALQMRGDLDASVGAVAGGVTVFFLAGAVGAGPGGRFAERLGALAAMRTSVLITAACLFAVAAVGSTLAIVFALLAVAGLANAVNQPAINLFMADQVPIDRQGLAFGIKQSAIPGAILVSGLALPAIALPLGWRATFAICGGLVLVVALVARSGGAQLPCPHRASARPARPARAALPRRRGGARRRRCQCGGHLPHRVGGGHRHRRGHGRPAGRTGQRGQPRGAARARCPRRPPARLRLRHGGGAARARLGRVPADDHGRDGALRHRRAGRVRAGLGVARAVQPGRGGEPPRGAGRRHRHHADGDLRGGVGRSAALRPPVAPARIWPLVGGGGRGLAAGGARDGRGRPRGRVRQPAHPRAGRRASGRRTAGRASRRRRARPRRSPPWPRAAPAPPPPAPAWPTARAWPPRP